MYVCVCVCIKQIKEDSERWREEVNQLGTGGQHSTVSPRFGGVFFSVSYCPKLEEASNQKLQYEQIFLKPQQKPAISGQRTRKGRE